MGNSHWPWNVESTIGKAELSIHKTNLLPFGKTGGYLHNLHFRTNLESWHLVASYTKFLSSALEKNRKNGTIVPFYNQLIPRALGMFLRAHELMMRKHTYISHTRLEALSRSFEAAKLILACETQKSNQESERKFLEDHISWQSLYMHDSN